MKRIVVLTTGGTIAMRNDASAGGAVPALHGGDFLGALPVGLAEIQVREFANLPSAHLTVELLWALVQQVRCALDEDGVGGLVVTHGTDTLEESAFLSDLIVSSDKPVVFTGAMRTSSELGYDGTANLAASIRVALSDQARGLGTLVVLNDEIHAARHVTKTDATNPATFRSPEWGPIGRVHPDGVSFAMRLSGRDLIPAARLEPDVWLLKIGVGMGSDLLSFLIDRSAHGVVIEGLGGGRVPPWWLGEIERARKREMPVVITARVGSARLADPYGYAGAHRDLVASGCWFAHGLNGQKARIKLMAALGMARPGSFFSLE